MIYAKFVGQKEYIVRDSKIKNPKVLALAVLHNRRQDRLRQPQTYKGDVTRDDSQRRLANRPLSGGGLLFQDIKKALYLRGQPHSYCKANCAKKKLF